VDCFKDRVIFPIRQDDDIVRFIGRRNPTKDQSEYAGPKYLNTRATVAFTKGQQLYGLAEGRDELAAGATPVLVEGPLDALAVTIAGRGEFVGVAPLGTAFTTKQAARLKPYFREEPNRIIIATDPDLAGWASGQRAFWHLAALGADPQHLALPAGVDPADLLATEGHEALASHLAEAQLMATWVLDRLFADTEDPNSAATRLRLVRGAGQVIGALPPERWLAHIESVTQRLGLPVGMLHLEVADSGATWTEAPAELASRYITQLSRLAQGATTTTRWDRPIQRGVGETPAPVGPVLVDPYRLGTPPRRPMPNYLPEGSRSTRGFSR